MGQNARFEVIRESNKTFSKHIVLDEKSLYHRAHDQATTPTTIAVAPRFNEGYRGLVWQPWIRLVDRLREDEQLLDTIYEAQGERYPQSRRLGREQTPARSGVASAVVETHSTLDERHTNAALLARRQVR